MALKLTGSTKDRLQVTQVMATSDFASSVLNTTDTELQVSTIQSSHFAMATYKTVLFKFNGDKRTLERGLTLEEAQAICKHSDSSSRTCTNRARLDRYGRDKNNPWFIGYTEE